jgi:5-methylcytosine-specific restriction endonuclease McrBC GTP-binding regulatory subunit McrB
MSINKTPEQVWDEFLQRWPLESLPDLTLQQYSTAGDTDTLTYWLEVLTEDLGSMWGGSSFKFGIYSRKDKTAKESGGGSSYSTDYAWYSKYGDTPEAAFVEVKSIVLAVANAARLGDLASIDSADLGTVTKWKLAFLYQDRAKPCIVPMYLEDSLRRVSGMAKPASLATIHAALMAKRNDVPLLTYGSQLWAEAERLRLAWSTERMKALLDDAEDIKPVKAATQKKAGYQLPDGRQLAVNRESSTPTLFLEPGAWQQTAEHLVGKLEFYPPDRSRHSGLEANAPRLYTGNPAVLVSVPSENDFRALLDAYLDPDNAVVVQVVAALTKKFQAMTNPLNQILYGPPGTGKTYETIYAALQILDPAAAAAYKQVDDDKAASPAQRLAARAALKTRFDELAAEQRVRFVTFHQSFSYEDFVEGLRASTVNGQLQYRVEAGVFKQICDDASATPESVNLDALLDAFIEQVAEEPQMLHTATGKQFLVSYGEGNTTLTCEPQAGKAATKASVSLEHIRALLAGKLLHRPNWPSYVRGIAEHVRKQPSSPAANLVPSAAGLPHVLIIDEINRGNISRIFGELITLIEPSKRAGADEALSVTLPYSKDSFSVPDNVYIIGTMNTADRSLAGLDLALRRRFSFSEMPPRPDLLDGVMVDGVNIGQMLRVMNQRITVLLDRDHTIGHVYFMPLQAAPTLAALADIFRQKILPLLQEYFFEDWERIRWVLNDQTKPDGVAFIIEDKSLEVSALFQGVADKLRQSSQWVLNDKAFDQVDAYRGIAANLGKGEE